MVHFPGLARTRLCVQRAVTGFFPVGFPHSDIPGSKGVSPYPRLFAGNRVLHRRLAPRHSPYALSSLTINLLNTSKPGVRSRKSGARGINPNPQPRNPNPAMFADSPFFHCPDPIPDSRSHQLLVATPGTAFNRTKSQPPITDNCLLGRRHTIQFSKSFEYPRPTRVSLGLYLSSLRPSCDGTAGMLGLIPSGDAGLKPSSTTSPLFSAYCFEAQKHLARLHRPLSSIALSFGD